MTSEFVTVVIPCYNQARFLHEAIESVRRQTHARHQVIVVDDGSTDDTATVAAQYAEVHLLRQANRGLAAARNSGLAAARGDYVVFMDADDRFLPDALEAGLQSLAGQPAAVFAYGHVKLIAGDGAPLPTPHQSDVEQDHYLELLRNNEEAIESVFAQSYRDWELLLVNDGSTDGSAAIARAYAERAPGKVRCLEHAGRRNRGMSASRNLGIEEARGHYVAFLDADDVWLPQKLERQVALIEAHPRAGLIYGPVQWWHQWTGRPLDAARDFIDGLNATPNTLAAPPSLLISLLTREAPTATNSLVRRALARQVGGFEMRFGGMYEDQAFFAKVCLAAPVFVAGECWYKWRKHADSCCVEALRDGRYVAARRKFLHWLEAYMLERKIEDGEV